MPPPPHRQPPRRSGSTAEPVTEDEWQAHVTREAAKEIGAWLEARGRLDQPIRSLTMRDLEALAQNAITRFIVLASRRVAQAPDSSGDLRRFLMSG